MQAHAGFGPEVVEGRCAVSDLVTGAITIKPGSVVVQRVGRRTGFVVVHADVVGRGVVGLRVEITQAHHTEVARQVHFALAFEGQRARAIVRAKTRFQLETSLQTVAQVFHTFEADA